MAKKRPKENPASQQIDKMHARSPVSPFHALTATHLAETSVDHLLRHRGERRKATVQDVQTQAPARPVNCSPTEPHVPQGTFGLRQRDALPTESARGRPPRCASRRRLLDVLLAWMPPRPRVRRRSKAVLAAAFCATARSTLVFARPGTAFTHALSKCNSLLS